MEIRIVWVLGIKFRPSCLPDQHCSNGLILPVPRGAVFHSGIDFSQVLLNGSLPQWQRATKDLVMSSMFNRLCTGARRS